MSDTVLTTLIKATPGVLWVVFAATVFFVLRRPLVEQLSRLRAANTPFGTFDFEVALTLVERAAEGQETRSGAALPSLAERRAVATRLEHAAALIAGRRVLWVDDDPGGNESLVELFERAGMSVRVARSTGEALAALEHSRFDLVITDLARPGEPLAGFDLVDRLAARNLALPVILYTLGFDPWQGVHPDLFAYTTSYDDLIHLVIDVLERLQFGVPESRPTDGQRAPSPRQGGSA